MYFFPEKVALRGRRIWVMTGNAGWRPLLCDVIYGQPREFFFVFQYREERIKKEVEKFRKERPKIQQQFTDLKRELVSSFFHRKLIPLWFKEESRINKNHIVEVYHKHGRTPENVRRLHIIADKCGYPQVRKSKILIFTNICKCSET